MKDYYFSGVDRGQHLRLLAQEQASGMVNACVSTQPNLLSAYQDYPRVPLSLDSGAFQGNTNLAGYAQTIKQLKDRFVWCVNLDVIGDQAQSDRNWEDLNALGVKTVWVYQVEGGRSLDHLKAYAERERFVGIGGLVPVLQRDFGRAIGLIEQVGQTLETVEASAHFLGVGSPQIIARYGQEPWFASADSQTWLCGYKTGELIRRDGSRLNARNFGIALSQEECAAQNIRQVRGWMTAAPHQMVML